MKDISIIANHDESKTSMDNDPINYGLSSRSNQKDEDPYVPPSMDLLGGTATPTAT